jgi:hypothetical protein
MDAGLSLLPWPVQLGVIGFLILIIVTILVRHERQISGGDLVPRITHDRELARERQRGDDFKEMWQVSDKRGDVMEQVAGNIVTIGENMDHLLKSLPTPNGGGQ